MKEIDGVSAWTLKSKQIQWHVPSGTKIDPQRWMQLNFSKPSVGKKTTRGASLCLSQWKDPNFPIVNDIIPSHYFAWNVSSCEIRPLKQFLSFIGCWLFLYCCIFIDKFTITQEISEIHLYVSCNLANKRHLWLLVIVQWLVTENSPKVQTVQIWLSRPA